MRWKAGVLSPPGSHQLQPCSGASSVDARARYWVWFPTSKARSTGEPNPGGQVGEAACDGRGRLRRPQRPPPGGQCGREPLAASLPSPSPGPPGRVFMERLHLSDCAQPGAGKMRPREALMQKIIARRDTACGHQPGGAARTGPGKPAAPREGPLSRALEDEQALDKLRRLISYYHNLLSPKDCRESFS